MYSRAASAAHNFFLPSGKKKSVGGVTRLFRKRISDPGKKRPELPLVPRRHLHSDQHAAVVRPVITVVEKGDIPGAAHRGQKLHERAGPLRKLEAVEDLVGHR